MAELDFAKLNETTRFRFVRSEVERFNVAQKAKAPATVAVLATFDIERQGDQVRVIDGDGSIYLGRLLTGTEAGQARFGEAWSEEQAQTDFATGARIYSVETTPQPTKRTREVRAGTNFVFRVTGTNRALGQLVTLEASMTGAAVEAKSTQSFGGAKVADAVVAPANANSFFGRLRVGNSEEVSIIAAPAGK